MLNLIKYYDGSIQNINLIPEKIRKIYKTSFEIDQKIILKQAALRGKWIDQSQSINIFFASDSGSELENIYIKEQNLDYFINSLGTELLNNFMANANVLLNKANDNTKITAQAVQTMSMSALKYANEKFQNTPALLPLENFNIKIDYEYFYREKISDLIGEGFYTYIIGWMVTIFGPVALILSLMKKKYLLLMILNIPIQNLFKK